MRTAVVGHLEWVQFARVESVPEPGDIVHATEFWAEPGGGGAGAAMQLLALAGECTFFTALGDDELGHRAHALLVERGLDVEAVFRPEETRRAFTHVDPAGERAITVLGERLAPRGEDSLAWDLLEGVDCLYFTAGDVEALRKARAAQVLVATTRTLETLAAAGVALDALVGSALDPSEAYRPGDVQPPPRLVVATEGADGGSYFEGGRSHRYEATPLEGPVVDRYGAGDAFAAGLTFGLGAGAEVRAAIQLGSRCGAAVITGRGPVEGRLTQADLEVEA